jgi:hypothetical protein
MVSSSDLMQNFCRIFSNQISLLTRTFRASWADGIASERILHRDGTAGREVNVEELLQH